jgi:hypothetical protein
MTPKATISRSVANFYPPPVSGLVTPWTIEVFSASREPERWRAHREFAHLSLIKRRFAGIDRHHATIRNDCATYVAEATLNKKPVGGVNINFPNAANRLPVLDWLEEYADTKRLENFIKSQVAQGIVQCSGLWTDPEQRSNGLSGDLGRAYIAMIKAAKVRFYLTICPQHTLAPFCSLGSEPVTEFPPFPYPDERYQTYTLIGDIRRWPADLATWAQSQAAGVGLNGAKVSWIIKPMRTAVAVVEKTERIEAWSLNS